MTEPAGKKYRRTVRCLVSRKLAEIDVYTVLVAFPTGHPGVDHAVKKLLMPGQRGGKDRLTDLTEARAALDRAIEDARNTKP